MHQHPLFLCLAQGPKGQILLEQARSLGVRTLLLAHQATQGQWAAGVADEVFYFPDFGDREGLCKTVAYLARSRRFEAIFPLDELSVEGAALLREQLGLEGLELSQAHRFRDKLLMRQAAARAGIPQPRFVAAYNDQALREFALQVAPPWYLKPRSLAGSAGILRVESEAELFQQLAELGDERSFYLLEEAVDGPVFHVDSLVFGHQISFAQVHAYGESPWKIAQHGGVFSTATLHDRDPANSSLRFLNERVIGALGLARGVVHAEFLERAGRYYFLEAAARVGGANIDVLVEQSSGLNLWREWLRMELSALRALSYNPPPLTPRYGAMLTCLTRQSWPNLEQFNASEVVWKLHRLHHAGLVLVGPDHRSLPRRVQAYKSELERHFLAVLPPRRVSAGRT